MSSQPLIFTGNANPQLAEDIARHLNAEMGEAIVGRFNDGESQIKFETNVRGRNVYIVQSTCTPVNENLMDLLLMISTARRASAKTVTAIIPYYGYARQDRKMESRVPISAADVARLIQTMGVSRVACVDLHCGQIQGFFGPKTPVDNLSGSVVAINYFHGLNLDNIVIVSPDAGGVPRAKKFLAGLTNKTRESTGQEPDITLAMIIKQRAQAGVVASMNLVGDVNGRTAIIVDDMIDTAGTLCKAAEHLKEQGATEVYAFSSHGVFSGPALERIQNSIMTEVVVLDTIPVRGQCDKIRYLSVAKLLADTVTCIEENQSVSALFDV